MILRIFATDGFTPERIFRWSVEETAEYLCEKQVLWVTHLKAPGWKGLVDWFVKKPCCRAVVLDTADRWDWYTEHEITWRIAQGLYFGEEEKIEAVCWLHDDMAPPTCRDFKEHLKAWLTSPATVMEAPAYLLWDDFNLVRADTCGINLAGDYHCWLAKWSSGLRWLRSAGQPTFVGDAPETRFKPLGALDPWRSPWPFRHAKGVDKDFREGRGFIRKGSPSALTGVCQQQSSVPRCLPYDPKLMWEEFLTGAKL